MASRLHLIMTPSERCQLDCKAMTGPSDQVVLVDAGVELLAQPGDDRKGGLLALEVDVRARGLEKLADDAGVTLISDLQWLEMVQSHLHCLSWK